MTTASYFSGDYEEARSKFIDAAERAGSSLAIFPNRNLGPTGNGLFTDVAVLGSPDAPIKLVLGSGTHGIEGFCGSAIQTGLLHEGLAERLPPDMAVILIHAINPYGFAYLRRVNEDSVDVNRNFVDHAGPHPQNPAYEDLADVIAPRSYSAAAIIYARSRLRLYRLVHGKPALQAAIAGGQYTHPDGLFYGGRFETWSNRTLREIARRYLANAADMVFVDFHTGLGPRGYGEITSHDPVDSPAYRRIKGFWGERAKSATMGKAVSTDLSGTVKMAFAAMLPATRVAGVVLEFGTEPFSRVFGALQAENWLHHHGSAGDPRAPAIRTAMRRAFYPDASDWKDAVWRQGKLVVEQAIAGLTG